MTTWQLATFCVAIITMNVVLTILSRARKAKKKAFKQRVLREMAERGEQIPRKFWGPDTTAKLVLLVFIGLLCVLAGSMRQRMGWLAYPITILLAIGALSVYGIKKREWIVMRAYKMEKRGDREAALQLLRDAINTRPTERRVAGLAFLLKKAGDLSEAAATFARAAQMNPATTMYGVERAMAMARSARGEDALAELKLLRANAPHEAAWPLAMAGILAELGRLYEASEQLRQSDDLFNAFPRAEHACWTFTSLRKELRARLPQSIRAFQVADATRNS